MNAIQTLDDVVLEVRGLGDLLEQILARMPTAAERFAEEERRAWDCALVSFLREPAATERGAAEAADRALAQRRQRFPPPESESGAVAVQRSLLEAIVQVGATEGQVGLRQLLEQLGDRLK